MTHAAAFRPLLAALLLLAASPAVAEEEEPLLEEAGIGPGLDLRLAQEGARGAATPYPADPAQRVWGGAIQAWRASPRR